MPQAKPASKTNGAADLSNYVQRPIRGSTQLTTKASVGGKNNVAKEITNFLLEIVTDGAQIKPKVI